MSKVVSVVSSSRVLRSLAKFGVAIVLGAVPSVVAPASAQAQEGRRLLTPGQVFEQGLAAFDAKDFVRSAELFDRACEKGVSNACMNLAVQYMTGDGVTQNPPRGLAMFERGCTLGNNDSCANARIARGQLAAIAKRDSTRAALATTAAAPKRRLRLLRKRRPMRAPSRVSPLPKKPILLRLSRLVSFAPI
jgi:hypothetical protein